MILSCDPGASGGIAWHHKGVTGCEPMPATRKDCIKLFVDILYDEGTVSAEDSVAYIEKISGFIPDGGASQMFEFGKSVERVGCILETLGVRIIEVGPKEWQKALHLGAKEKVTFPLPPKGLDRKDRAAWNAENSESIKSAKRLKAQSKTAWKNKLKEEAQRRFPQLDITLKTADALLILDYAREMERAIQNTPELFGKT